MRRDFRRQATQLRRIRAKYMVYCIITVLIFVALLVLYTIQSFSKTAPPTRQTTTIARTHPTPSAFYHTARNDRSGAVIHDMLLAHAYAFKHNRSYGGACALHPLEHTSQHLEMIEALGLSHILQFACPKDPAEISSMISESKVYRNFNTRVWTKEWLEYIRGARRPPAPVFENNNVVVHIRRGDVSLCDSKTKDRYLVNQHYLNLLHVYLREIDPSTGLYKNVTIFSESPSPEPWQDFAGIQVSLDDAPSTVWKAMLDAKVLILSKSSFSIVPAIFNPNTIVYTPFWVEPLPEWTVVDDDSVRVSQRAAIRLYQVLCEGLGAV